MDNNLVKKKIKNILYHHIFLIVLLILICFCHFLFVSKFSIVIRSLTYLFYFSMAVNFVEIIFLLHPIYSILSKRICPTIIKKTKNRLLFFLSISILNGICLTYVHWTNFLKLPKYIEECPYNFSLYHIKKLFSGFSDTTSNNSKKCSFRRCFLDNDISQNDKKNNENENDVYNYICNYVHDYYGELKNNFVTCRVINSLSSYENYDEIFYDYLKYCDSYTSFYVCEHKYKVEKNLYLNYNDKCPTKYNKKNYQIIGALFMIIDLIGVSSIWFITFLEYSKTLKILIITIDLNMGNRMSPSSLNSTNDCSVIIQNNNTTINNQTINLQTEFLFYPDPNNNTVPEEIINNTRNTSITNDINIHNFSNLTSKNELIQLKHEQLK